MADRKPNILGLSGPGSFAGGTKTATSFIVDPIVLQAQKALPTGQYSSAAVGRCSLGNSLYTNKPGCSHCIADSKSLGGLNYSYKDFAYRSKTCCDWSALETSIPPSNNATIFKACSLICSGRARGDLRFTTVSSQAMLRTKKLRASAWPRSRQTPS